MDFQKLLDTISQAASDERSLYHVNLGALREAAMACSDGRVIVDGERGLGREHSYRGYYSELAFTPTNEPSLATAVKDACDRALSDEYTGWKGGEYRYNDRTPLWFAMDGDCGPAIVALQTRDGDVHLTTKDTGF